MGGNCCANSVAAMVGSDSAGVAVSPTLGVLVARTLDVLVLRGVGFAMVGTVA